MDIIIKRCPSIDAKKIRYSLEWGRMKGQRVSTKIFTYAKPGSQAERNHNKEALLILERKRAQLIIERQSISSGYIPQHKFKNNFLDYYKEFVEKNRCAHNRHLEGSLSYFKAFMKVEYLAPIDVTENLCERFRKYLLEKFNGGTPAGYFARFKRVLKAATKDGYFRISPSADIAAKANKNFQRKENLEVPEYIQLLHTPCLNEEVRDAFIFCCYTGLRWCDVKTLSWKNVSEDTLVVSFNQSKTGVATRISVHEITRSILEKRKRWQGSGAPSGRVFNLSSQERALKILDTWCKSAGLTKHITWHCARHSFSILLQDKNVDGATVAALLGQLSTKYVEGTYKRYRFADMTAVIAKLPSLETNAS
jgi:integrase/recombinase XerD